MSELFGPLAVMLITLISFPLMWRYVLDFFE